MIIYNKKEIKQDHFGDGTLKAEVPERLNKSENHLDLNFFGTNFTETITWCYDNDAEIFTLRCLVDAIREAKGLKTEIDLILPYIPHARQDREVSGRFFTLKTFASMINEMKFNKVKVLDPHSDVAPALIDRCIQCLKPVDVLVIGAVAMYPDAGAAKKYKADSTAIIGNKKRDEKGNIVDYQLLNFIEGTKTVCIIDDICSYGGTFVYAAKALKEKGVENISLIVSHCEDNILKGEVFDYFDGVYTTDSICHVQHEKLRYLDYYKFREVDEEKTS